MKLGIRIHISAEELHVLNFGFSVGATHRLHSSSFLGLPYRIPKMYHKKELL